MNKQIKVDVQSSLGYQANGRLKPAIGKEIAQLTIKTFICPKCYNEEEASKEEFGEIKKCQKCGTAMIQQL